MLFRSPNGNEPVIAAAMNDPRMYQLFVTLVNDWDQAGGSLYNVFALNGLNGSWGYFDMLPNVAAVGSQEYDALVSLLDPVAPAAPEPADAGFELPSAGPAGAWGSYVYNPTGTAWSFTGLAGVSANGSGFTEGNPPAPEGAQVGVLQQTGSFSQSVAGWAGGSYVITFDAAQRGNNGGSYQEDFEVLVDGTVVSTFTPPGAAYQGYSTAAFTVGAGPHTITFQGLDSVGGDNTALIDAVAVTQAGQPADAGFEQPNAGPGSFVYDPSGTAWSFTGPAGVSANGSGFTSGNPPPPRGCRSASCSRPA